MGSTDTPEYRQEETLRRLYCEENLSTIQIADQFGVNKETIRNWMIRHGIERRDKADKHRREHATFKTGSKGYEWWRDYHGGEKVVGVHQLVAVAEYGFDMVAGKDTHHRNKIPWDNRPENIEVMSQSEHSSTHARERVGDKNPNSTLTEKDVREMKRKLSKTSLTQDQIAQEFGINQPQVSKIKRGEDWSHID